MPITAKLSHKFYEKLGDDVANELVEWLNLVDTSYRQEFKDLFEANFRRVESELAGLRGHLTSEMGRVAEQMRGLREHVDTRITGIEGVMNARLLGVEGGMVELQRRLLAEMDAKLGKMDVRLGRQKWSLLTWTILMWLGTLGFMAAMLKH